MVLLPVTLPARPAGKTSRSCSTRSAFTSCDPLYHLRQCSWWPHRQAPVYSHRHLPSVRERTLIHGITSIAGPAANVSACIPAASFDTANPFICLAAYPRLSAQAENTQYIWLLSTFYIGILTACQQISHDVKYRFQGYAFDVNSFSRDQAS